MHRWSTISSLLGRLSSFAAGGARRARAAFRGMGRRGLPLALALVACGTGERLAPTAADEEGPPVPLEAIAVPVRVGQGPPRFEEYPAAEVYRGAAAPVDLSSHPDARTRADVLREAAARGPDFAGRYAIVSWREPGRIGESFLILDVRTGRVHAGRTDVTPMEYRLDSRLIRFAAPEPLPGRIRCAGCIESYEVWDRERLALIPPEYWAPSAPPPVGARELVERVRAEEEPPILASYAPAVLRPTWDRLVITAEDGTRRVFSDEVAGGELRSIHQFAGIRDPLPVFVIVRHLVPEGRAVLMVDRRTGEVTELDDFPSGSPDGERFATASLDLVAGHQPNRIRIYRMQGDRPVLEWEVEPKEWGGYIPRWRDEHTLEVQRGMLDWSTHEVRAAPLLITRQPAGWRIGPLSPDHARHTLQSFLSALAEGRYAEATLYYGGSYELMRAWNPGLDPHDRPALWREACTHNGLRCPGRAEVLRTEELSPDEVRLDVRLYTERGQPLVLGPCCGETEATMPSRREFAFTLRRDGARYLVMDLPPYQP